MKDRSNRGPVFLFPSVLAALFALGFPLSMVPDTSFLADCRAPRLFVQGEQDPFGSGAQLENVVARLPEPRSLVVVPAADHFFTGHLDALQETVRAWAASRPWERPG